MNIVQVLVSVHFEQFVRYSVCFSFFSFFPPFFYIQLLRALAILLTPSHFRVIGSKKRTVAIRSGKDPCMSFLLASIFPCCYQPSWYCIALSLFSQDSQHTAIHSNGVTQALTTEPPLSEAQHNARPRSAAGPYIGESLCQSNYYVCTALTIWRLLNVAKYFRLIIE